MSFRRIILSGIDDRSRSIGTWTMRLTQQAMADCSVRWKLHKAVPGETDDGRERYLCAARAAIHYDFECVGYDNKYNAAEGAKVARDARAVDPDIKKAYLGL